MAPGESGTPAPLVSIGVPTYNRGPLLDLAVASALAQTVTDIEVVISDNASADDTAARCATWLERDPRVRVIRQESNVGPTENFNTLFAACDGDFVAMLSDDDTLDADYVASCLTLLEGDPSLVAVAGTARYVRGGEFVHQGAAVTLVGDTARQRVLAYFRRASDGPFYGLVRRDVVRTAAPMPNVLANDWLHIGRVAAQGRVAMVDSTHINRELGGTSASVNEILTTFGSHTAGARVPHLIMAWQVFQDIGWRGDAYASLGGTPRRLWVALCAAPRVIDIRSLAWHLTAPTMQRLAQHRSTAWIAHGFDRLTRGLGAGHQD